VVKTPLNIVWLKRDLRLQDHAPFLAAEASEANYIPIYIFEPSIINYPDCSKRHLQFIYHSILEMNQSLKTYHREVIMFHAEADEVFEKLSELFEIREVFSYQESGIKLTWDRDRHISKLFKKRNIGWTEFQRDGIIRGIRNRNGWDKRWFVQMHKTIIENKYSLNSDNYRPAFLPVDDIFKKELSDYPSTFQKAGSSTGWRYLKSFCKKRGKDYSWQISKPSESRKSCGRISPYLAWGNLSIRQAYQYIYSHKNKNRYKTIKNS